MPILLRDQVYRKWAIPQNGFLALTSACGEMLSGAEGTSNQAPGG